ncbi:MAG: hypothetical protein ABJD13_16005 [Paracoccaceae bacterium]
MRRSIKNCLLNIVFLLSPFASQAGLLDDVGDFLEEAVDVVADIPKVVLPLQPAIDIVRGKKNPDEAISGLVNDAGQLLQDGTQVIRTVDRAVNQTFAEAVDAVGGDIGTIIYEVTFGGQRYMSEAVFTSADAVGQVLQGEDPAILIGLPLAAAIRDSRNKFAGSAQPLPDQVKQVLAPIIPASVLNRARITTGTVKISLPTAISAIGPVFADEKDAVTIDDTIVYLSEPDFNTQSGMLLLVHELYHVYQYEQWGVDLFAYRYLKNYARVEAEAEQAEQHAASYIAQALGGSAFSAASIVAGHQLTQQQTIQTPMGPTTIYVPTTQNQFMASISAAPLTDRCVVNGEHVVVNVTNSVFSISQGGLMVGQRLPPLHPACFFDLVSISNARYCVEINSGYVFAETPYPVGVCQPCNGPQCFQ